MAELPNTTSAWRTHQTGPITKHLQLDEDVPLPQLKPGQALVAIEAAGLNPADWKLAELPIFFAQKLPRTQGSDFSGRVLAWQGWSNDKSRKNKFTFPLEVGQAVFGFFPAETIFTRSQGALQRYAVCNLDWFLPKSSSLSFQEAAGITTAALTAIQFVKQVRKGDRVLLLGGTTAVGLYTSEMVKSELVQASHLCVTASGSKVDFVKNREKGRPDEIIDYRSQDVEAYLTKSCKEEGQRPFDIILDCVGSPRTYDHSPNFLKKGGVHLNIGFSMAQSGSTIRSMLPIVRWIFKSYLLPTWLGDTPRKCSQVALAHNREDWEFLNRLVQGGHLDPVVDSTYSFDQAKEAYTKLMEGRALGKIIVNVKAEADRD